MHVLDVENVSEAYFGGRHMLHMHGMMGDSRNGPVAVLDEPVTTVYRNPRQRVLFAEGRVPNAPFHLMESLWMLAGRRDATFLDQFISDFSKRYAEPGTDGRQHGAYGYRWRRFFSFDDNSADQLDEVVHRLKKNNDDRRAVIQMWDASADLLEEHTGGLLDVPCNLVAVPRVVRGRLDLAVTCRSNDMIWGAYGANAVHFSVLQEYLAARIGVDVGVYRQISLNMHAYADSLEKHQLPGQAMNLYEGDAGRVTHRPLVDHPESFDAELLEFLEDGPHGGRSYRNEFLSKVARPVWAANAWKRAGEPTRARAAAARCAASDWRLGTAMWLDATVRAKAQGSAA